MDRSGFGDVMDSHEDRYKQLSQPSDIGTLGRLCGQGPVVPEGIIQE